MSFPRYPEYKNSGVKWLGQVPAHWTVAALSYRYEVALGKMLDAKLISGQHLAPYLRNADVQWGEIRTSNLNEMDFQPEDRVRFSLKRGDLLVCEGGEVGRCAVWEVQVDECYYQKALHRLRPYDALKDSPWFLQWVLHAAVHAGCFAADESKATIAHLPAEAFRRYRFALPPFHEQGAIAAFLDRETGKTDALVAEQARLIELLKEKRQAVISHAVTKGLNPDAPMKQSGIEWLGEVPKHWEIKRFQRCVYVVEGQVDPEDARFAGMTLIAPNHIESGTGRILGMESAAEQGAESGKYPCRAGDVVYSKIRPALRKVCIVHEDCLCSADMYPLRAHSGLTNPFLLLVMLSEQFSALAVLESQRVAMPKINRESLKEVYVAVPPVGEQTAVVKQVTTMTAEIDALIAEAQRAIDLLQERRTALISAAVTGQIDVRAAKLGDPALPPDRKSRAKHTRPAAEVTS